MHAAAAAGASAGLFNARMPWVAPLLWGAAMVEFVAAGLGLLGVQPLARRWRTLVVMAATASLLLVVLWHGAMMAPGIALDLIFVGLALRWRVSAPWTAVPATTRIASAGNRHLAHVGHAVAFAFLGYLVLLVIARPWHTRWGVTDAEVRAPLPGDELAPNPQYQVMHGVTIHAPADSVWPWLAQIGQDRGGFYSYEWLERLIGDDIRNADSIVPAWTHRRVGELVRATQSGYLGGIAGTDPGWRITRIDPGRVLVLRGWGAFVLVPIDERTTRLLVRSRSPVPPPFIVAPLNTMVLEPAHFIMERGMLRGIKRRAERLTHATVAQQRPSGAS
jgi:hypothetical protein